MLVLGELNIVLCFGHEEIGRIITLKNGTEHLEKLSDCTDGKEKGSVHSETYGCADVYVSEKQTSFRQILVWESPIF